MQPIMTSASLTTKQLIDVFPWWTMQDAEGAGLYSFAYLFFQSFVVKEQWDPLDVFRLQPLSGDTNETPTFKKTKRDQTLDFVVSENYSVTLRDAVMSWILNERIQCCFWSLLLINLATIFWNGQTQQHIFSVNEARELFLVSLITKQMDSFWLFWGQNTFKMLSSLKRNDDHS